MFPKIWSGFARISFLMILCFSGCAAGLPEQRTVFVSSGLPESLSRILSEKLPDRGQMVLLGGRIKRIFPTEDGVLFLVQALPLAGETPISVNGRDEEGSPLNTFLVEVSSLRVPGSRQRGVNPPGPNGDSSAKELSASLPLNPGDLVTLLGEVLGKETFFRGHYRAQYLLVEGRYIERWNVHANDRPVRKALQRGNK